MLRRRLRSRRLGEQQVEHTLTHFEKMISYLCFAGGCANDHPFGLNLLSYETYVVSLMMMVVEVKTWRLFLFDMDRCHRHCVKRHTCQFYALVVATRCAEDNCCTVARLKLAQLFGRRVTSKEDSTGLACGIITATTIYGTDNARRQDRLEHLVCVGMVLMVMVRCEAIRRRGRGGGGGGGVMLFALETRQ